MHRAIDCTQAFTISMLPCKQTLGALCVNPNMGSQPNSVCQNPANNPGAPKLANKSASSYRKGYHAKQEQPHYAHNMYI